MLVCNIIVLTAFMIKPAFSPLLGSDPDIYDLYSLLSIKVKQDNPLGSLQTFEFAKYSHTLSSVILTCFRCLDNRHPETCRYLCSATDSCPIKPFYESKDLKLASKRFIIIVLCSVCFVDENLASCCVYKFKTVKITNPFDLMMHYQPQILHLN